MLMLPKRLARFWHAQIATLCWPLLQDIGDSGRIGNPYIQAWNDPLREAQEIGVFLLQISPMNRLMMSNPIPEPYQVFH